MEKLKIVELVILIISATIGVVKAVIKFIEHINRQKRKVVAFA